MHFELLHGPVHLPKAHFFPYHANDFLLYRTPPNRLY
jgi:hypothetical protein